MMVTIEKREVAGTLITPLGTFTLLGQGRGDIVMAFPVKDDEGFENWILVRGDFVVVPDPLCPVVEVKRVLNETEVKATNIPPEILPDTID